ncbi:hypothetical protein D8T50_05655 [Vibrio vulnificus]|nr:hypothetical protein D8T50_05655 [Vibrio vulnificus]
MSIVFILAECHILFFYVWFIIDSSNAVRAFLISDWLFFVLFTKCHFSFLKNRPKENSKVFLKQYVMLSLV